WHCAAVTQRRQRNSPILRGTTTHATTVRQCARVIAIVSVFEFSKAAKRLTSLDSNDMETPISNGDVARVANYLPRNYSLKFGGAVGLNRAGNSFGRMCAMNFVRPTRWLQGSLNLRTALRVLATAAGILLISVPLLSQGNAGRILGSVTDQTGGVIVGAKVTVTDTQRGITRTLTTDQAGEYNAPNLLPGTYSVRAESQGFKTVERQNVVLEVNGELRVDLTVQPGEQA